ncbi:MAG: cyanophycin synthetase, partial [Chloracidobacterium sp.]
IKPGVPVYIADTQPEEARQALAQAALERQCEPRWVEPLDIICYDTTGRPVVCLDSQTSRTYGRECRLALHGRHQSQNAALATRVAQDYLRVLDMSDGAVEEAVCSGLEQTHWPGRLQWIDGNPPILLDGAHNPEGVQALADFLETTCRRRPVTTVFAAMRDKPVIELLSPLATIAERLIVTEVTGQSRAMPCDSLEVIALGYWLPSNVIQSPDVATALRLARASTPPDGLIVVYGSIYLIGEVLSLLQCQGA